MMAHFYESADEKIIHDQKYAPNFGIKIFHIRIFETETVTAAISAMKKNVSNPIMSVSSQKIKGAFPDLNNSFLDDRGNNKRKRRRDERREFHFQSGPSIHLALYRHLVVVKHDAVVLSLGSSTHLFSLSPISLSRLRSSFLSSSESET